MEKHTITSHRINNITSKTNNVTLATFGLKTKVQRYFLIYTWRNVAIVSNVSLFRLER